jgi:hypothetical protein
MKFFFLQNEITGTQTSFSSNFGGKLSFILCGIKHVTGNGIFFLQNEITGTQTSFSSNFGGKLSFMLSLSFSEFYSCLCYIYFQCSCHVDNYYNYSQTLCINSMYKKKIETLKLSLYPNWEKGRWFGSHPITYYFWMTNPHPLKNNHSH